MRRFRKVASVLGAGTVLGALMVVVPVPASAAEGYDYREITIPGADGTRLDGNVFVPEGRGPHPAIVFISSWSLEDHEYVAQAAKFAEHGYIVLSYTARGFLNSGGGIEVAGPLDIADGSKAIDWLIAHTAVDRRHIGFGGISYGSGISLMVAGRDRRVSAVVAMDTWGDLVESLYAGRTRHYQAYHLLSMSGRLTGRLSPQSARIMSDYEAYNNIEGVIRWAEVRSPRTYLHEINKRRVPVYILKAYGETFFPPNQLIDYYDRLAGPKRLRLTVGDHATTSGTGVLGLPNIAWNDAHRWFDHHLRGRPNGIADEPSVQSEVAWSRKVEQAPTWESYRRDAVTTPLADRTFRAGKDTVANGGVTLFSGGGQTFGQPITAPTELISRRDAAVWTLPARKRTIRLRGIPRLQAAVTPSGKSVTLIAYLYDVNAGGTGRLITHDALTLRSAPGRTSKAVLPLQATAYDVPSGHRIMLVVDTKDSLYWDASLPDTTVKMTDARLTLPAG